MFFFFFVFFKFFRVDNFFKNSKKLIFFFENKVLTGGRLFDFWFQLFASASQQSFVNDSKPRKLNPLFQRSLHSLTNHFYFSVLSSLRVSSKKNSKQAFLLSSVFVSKGLSNSGLSFLSKTGLVLPKTTFNIQRQKELTTLRRELIQQGRSTVSVHWVDNFSKYYNRSIFKVSRSNLVYQNSTVHAFTSTSLQQSILEITDPTLQSVSFEWFSDEFANSVLSFYNNLWSTNKWNRRYWSSSFIQMLLLDRPVQPNQPNQTDNSLKNLFPFEVYKENISSTVGLLKVFSKVQKNFFLQKYYLPFKVDITIYYQWHRLCFCDKFSFQPDFNFFTVLLAPWHTFKHGCEVVWRKYYNFLFAPFVLFADKKFCPRKKLKLTTSSSIFSYFLVAYEVVQGDFLTLQKYFQEFHPTSDYVPVLQNIIDLFEIYLPSLFDYYFNLNTSNFEQTEQSTLHLLQMFFSLSSSSDTYLSGLVLNLAQLFYLKKKNHPVVRVLSQDFLSFSEEGGEICLSLLAKSVLTDNLKGSIKHLSQNFTELLMVKKIVDQVGHEQFLTSRKLSRFERLKQITPETEEVLCVVKFLDELLTDLEFQIYLFFSPSVDNIKSSKPPKKGFYSQCRYFCEDPNSEFLDVYNSLKRRLEKVNYKPDVFPALQKLSLTTSTQTPSL